MRAKEEGGLATYYVFLVGGESVCGGEWRRERVRAPHLTHCNAHTHRDGGRLACLRARQCVHATMPSARGNHGPLKPDQLLDRETRRDDAQQKWLGTVKLVLTTS